MKKQSKLYASFLLMGLLFLSKLSFAGADDIMGIWFNDDKSAKIEIFKNGQKYYGRIVWLKEPLNEEGKEKVDKNNPDASKRSTKVMMLVILRNFIYDEDDKNYQDGNVYDPKNGKDYSCKMTLLDKNNLDVRGYVGLPAFGRTAKWVRTTK
jgi:uncharacterized protein (DUF2147 family)